MTTRCRPLRVALIFGTRPEAIKLAPVARLLYANPDRFAPILVSTGQHREMLQQVLSAFGLTPDVDLELMRENQGLHELAAAALTRLRSVLAGAKPDLVLVQGDTTTAFAGALAAAYSGIAVGHIEAGLRTGDIASPFPEEMNRRLITPIAQYHFAPTEGARLALLREGIAAESIHLTGNTVVDALLHSRKKAEEISLPCVRSARRESQRILVVTCHRRENFGDPLERILSAIRRVTDSCSDIRVVFPVHPNPNVGAKVHAFLDGHPRIELLPPLGYLEFVHLLAESHLILTDSGGVQEEAPTLSKPILVLRETTERPEGIDAGVARLVGTSEASIYDSTLELLRSTEAYSRMAHAANPYGDGQAANRICEIIRTAGARLLC